MNEISPTVAQQLLKSILQNKETMIEKHNDLQRSVAEHREHLIRIEGALEVFRLLGITLDEGTDEEEAASDD